MRTENIMFMKFSMTEKNNARRIYLTSIDGVGLLEYHGKLDPESMDSKF